MAKSAGSPGVLPAKTGRCTRLAVTPNASKSACESSSSVVPDTITPPLVARSMTRAATLTSTPSQSAARRCGRPVWIPNPHPRLCSPSTSTDFNARLAASTALDGDQRVGEHRHDAVAHPLDDVPAGIQQRRFDRPRHPPQAA